MSENATEKTYVFPENSGNSLCSSLIGMLAQKQGVDPAMLMAMNNNGFGGNSALWLFFLFAIFGGGWGGFGRNNGNAINTDADTMRLANLINNNDGRAQLMEAINGNKCALSNLSQTLGCSTSQITAAINGVSTLIQSVGSQVGMTSQQVINAIDRGDANVISQLQSGCCTLGNKISESNYENRLSVCQQTNTITGAINGAVQSIKDATDLRTDAIMARLDAMEKSAMQSKIDALQETKSTLQTQLNLEHQTRDLQSYQSQSLIPLTQAVAQLQAQVTAIKAAQLPTTTVPNPQVVGVPAALAYQTGLLGGNSLTGGSFWY